MNNRRAGCGIEKVKAHELTVAVSRRGRGNDVEKLITFGHTFLCCEGIILFTE